MSTAFFVEPTTYHLRQPKYIAGPLTCTEADAIREWIGADRCRVVECGVRDGAAMVGHMVSGTPGKLAGRDRIGAA